MARDFYIAGEVMVYVKGRSDSGIANISELGLATDQIRVSPRSSYEDLPVNAWGRGIPDTQWMLQYVMVTINLIHVDPAILAECMRLSQGGGGNVGQDGVFARAGQRLGNNQARFAPSQVAPATGLLAGNNYIGLNLAAPVNGIPWRFSYAHLADQPADFPLGTDKSVISTNWRVIPYIQDPWGNGTGAYNYVLWDHVLDN